MERIINQVIFINHNETKLINVAAYARVSVDKETMHHSLMAQIDYYKHLIEENPKWKLVDYGNRKNIPVFCLDRVSFR